MLNGYVTLAELELLSGLDANTIEDLIFEGLPYYRLDMNSRKIFKNSSRLARHRHRDKIFNYNEVIEWVINRLW